MCLVSQSWLTLFGPRDCNLPGSPVHGLLQIRILEWVVMPSSRGFSWPRDQTWVSCVAPSRPPKKPLESPQQRQVAKEESNLNLKYLNRQLSIWGKGITRNKDAKTQKGTKPKEHIKCSLLTKAGNRLKKTKWSQKWKLNCRVSVRINKMEI